MVDTNYFGAPPAVDFQKAARAVNLAQRLGETDQVARAWKASQVFRSKYLPLARSFARTITGQNVEVMVGPVPMTDGGVIYLPPPMELADPVAHHRPSCFKYDEHGINLCPACHIDEYILAVVLHEIAHIVGGTFLALPQAEVDAAMQAVLEQHAGSAGSRVRKIMKMVEDSEKDYRYASAMPIASVVSPFLPYIINALEDARVNRFMHEGRKGAHRMFQARARTILSKGIEDAQTGEREYVNERPLEAQASLAGYVMASGYTDLMQFFSDETRELWQDQELLEIAFEAQTTDSAAAVYRLAFRMLERFRELGLFKREDDPQDDPDPSDDKNDDQEQESGQPDDQESGQPDDQESGQEDSQPDDQESGQEDSQPDDSGQEDSASDSDADSQESGQEDSQPDASADDQEQESGQPDDQEQESGQPDDQEQESGQPDASDDDSLDGDGAEDEDAAPADGGEDDDDNRDGDDDGEAEGDDDGGEGQDDGQSDQGEADDDATEQGESSPESGQDDGQSDASEDTDEAEDDAQGEGAGDGAPAEDDDEAEAEAGDEGEGGAPGAGDPGDDDDDFDHDDWDDDDFDGDAEKPGDADASDGGDLDDDDFDDDDDAEASDTREGDGDADDYEEDEDGDENLPGGSGDPVPTETPEEQQSDVEEIEQLMAWLGGHQVGSFDIDKPITEVEQDAINLAVSQLAHFDEPSTTVGTVRWHTMDKHILIEDLDLTGILFYRSDGDGSNAADDPTYLDFVREHQEKVGLDPTYKTPERIITKSLAKARLIFAENYRARKVTGLRSGRPTGRHLYRTAVGNPLVFNKKHSPGKRDYFVILGIDASGSGIGYDGALETQKHAVMATAELLHRVGVPFLILAQSGAQSAELGWGVDILTIRGENEPWTEKQKERLRRLTPWGNNLDGHTMEQYRKLAERSNATDKIILYFTDGAMPAANGRDELVVLQREIKNCRNRGIHLMGVGIGTDSPSSHGLDTIQIDSMEDIPLLVNAIEKRITK